MAQLAIVVDDQLGDAARCEMTGLAESAALGEAYLYWPLTDAASSTVFNSAARNTELTMLETSGNNGPPLVTNVAVVPGSSATLGVDGPPLGGATQLELTATILLGSGSMDTSSSGAFPTITYPSAASCGWWSFWVELVTASPGFEFDVDLAGLGNYFFVTFDETTSRFKITAGGTGTPGLGASTVRIGDEHHLELSITQAGTVQTATLYMDGILQASSAYANGAETPINLSNAQKQPSQVRFRAGGSSTPDAVKTYRVSQLAHTATQIIGTAAAAGVTESTRLTAIAQAVPGMTLAALPAGLSPQLLDTQDTDGSSALDAMNAVMNAEQGYLYTVTSGTSFAPLQTTVVRERIRGRTPVCSFNSEDECHGSVNLVRELSNLVAAVQVQGPSNSVTVRDLTLVPRAGSATAKESVLLSSSSDLTLWGQDRLKRGSSLRFRMATVTVNAMDTPTDRSTDLLALLPGDRLRVTNLPSNVLRATTLDGYFIGVDETQSISEHTFELHCAIVLDDTGLFDTDRFDFGPEITLASTITSAAATLSCATTGPSVTSAAGDLPFTILIDAEQITVTAVAGTTLTITRGANGTTAAAHTAGAAIELATPTIFAF
jgi:hypothetical protein